jgi:uncharacterized protein YwgA
VTDQLGRKSLPLLAIDVATRGDALPLSGRTKLTKLVYLAQEEAHDAVARMISPDPFYDFEPYHYGPFSRGLLGDLEILEGEGLLSVKFQKLDSQGRITQYLYSLTVAGRAALSKLEAETREAAPVRGLLAKYASMDRSSLVDYIYSRYPNSVKV